ncbi:hypothetical protein PAE2222b [Pyrobaculum aerophilum str. IM2]|uniref:Uncharacterized protein n=1 Tax=Pyrobaculum aerophilum (strain ATCC 51768 / DSM 7523 / JCM 9630 / CIP 104966 / NBRC 100827 / IM2) TaxID=178306 RepID=Q8ZVL6_PYRAE|nr:hypothetical protein PAE2222b [Pyrobaculum aerophilum str. IM2]
MGLDETLRADWQFRRYVETPMTQRIEEY